MISDDGMIMSKSKLKGRYIKKFRRVVCGKEFDRVVLKNEAKRYCSRGCYLTAKREKDIDKLPERVINKVLQEVLTLGEDDFFRALELGKKQMFGDRFCRQANC
jgi:predicted RNA-binding protein YlxR (DUF448 family)